MISSSCWASLRRRQYNVIIFFILINNILSYSATRENVNKQKSVELATSKLIGGDSLRIGAKKEGATGLNEAASSPSITSVHQVWTSTSSGRLDELSPEMIGKLRNDVPFLAAYALRPRLVGAITSQPSGAIEPLDSYINQVPQDSSLAQQASDSSERRVSLVPKLGDFSEFKVETSSTSKSEHHHKRKTSLKRQPKEEKADRVNGELRLRKQVLQRANRLLKKRRDQRSGSLSNTKLRNGKLVRSQNSHANQLRHKLDAGNLIHHMSIIKHGRYILANDEDEKIPHKQQTQNQNQGEGTKGGGSSNRRPFYGSRTKDDPKVAVKKEDDQSSDVESAGKKKEKDEKLADGANEDSNEEESEADALEPPTTVKRVGDEDVEEEGDTVTVMPKYDGVDDDPELPEYDDEASENSPSERGKRIDREKPNDSRRKVGAENEADDSEYQEMNDDEPEKGGSAIGGGLGATTGSKMGNGSKDQGDDGMPVTPGVELAEEDDGTNDEDTHRDKENKDSSIGSGDKKKDSSDEEDGENNDDGEKKINSIGESSVEEELDMKRKPAKKTDGPTSSDKGGASPSGSRGESSDGDDADADADVERENVGKKKPKTGGKGEDSIDPSVSGEKDEESMDVDYRDELGKATRTEKRKEAESDSRTLTEQKSKHEGEEVDGVKQSKHCEDGSYDHHDSNHHHHHNSIKWLEDAIPGKPGSDYPIVGTINSTNFKCREQKYPGYYADVEYRCQVFHICQADGRQDSFLCPNGTIFSQKATVCVWWNSFDCEDAPKYYELNALLYKTPITVDGKQIMTELRPHDQDDRRSSTDSLIRAFPRRQYDDSINKDSEDERSLETSHPRTRTFMESGIGAENEASIQRKSTALSEDESSGLNGSAAKAARLRLIKAGPRRKRRASVRQAPPKLRSRRIIKNSRRWKLRHNLKPKRRA